MALHAGKTIGLHSHKYLPLNGALLVNVFVIIESLYVFVGQTVNGQISMVALLLWDWQLYTLLFIMNFPFLLLIQTVMVLYQGYREHKKKGDSP
jgi:hypothetical protein